MKNKQLTINMIANVLSFAINFGINFFFTPYLIETIGKEAYSFFPLANNFLSYINILAVALNSMAGRFITIKIQQNKEEEANKYFNSVLISNTIFAGILVIPSILFVVFLNNFLNVPAEILTDVQILFALVFGGMILTMMTSVFSVATFAANRLDLESLRNIEGNLLKVVTLLLLFYFCVPKVSYLGVSSLLVVIYVFIANIYYTRKLLPMIKLSKKYFDFGKIKELLSSGIWNTVNQLSIVLLTQLDLLISNVMINPQAAGEYSIVKTIPNFIQSLVGTLVGVFVPQFTILYAQKKEKELLDSINDSIKFMGITITIPIGFLIAFGDTFYSLWVPNENAQMLFLLSNLTIIPMIITGSINTIFNVYTVTNKLKIPALVWLAIAIVNVLMVVGLIKWTDLGIIAIPLVSFVLGIARNLLFTPIYAAKCLKVKWNTFYKAIGKGCICAVSMIIISFIFKSVFNVNSWIKLIATGAVCSIISLGLNIIIVLSKGERDQFIDIILKKLKIRKAQ